jgi:hypothetical protein
MTTRTQRGGIVSFLNENKITVECLCAEQQEDIQIEP